MADTKLLLADDDGDELEVKEVFGFECRILFLAITQDHEISAVRLNAEAVRQLRHKLDEFLGGDA